MRSISHSLRFLGAEDEEDDFDSKFEPPQLDGLASIHDAAKRELANEELDNEIRAKYAWQIGSLAEFHGDAVIQHAGAAICLGYGPSNSWYGVT